MNSFIIESVPYYTQRDNKIDPLISCFPTSLSMAIGYCLQTRGLDKAAIGCSPQMQIEDYINEVIYDGITTKDLQIKFGMNWWGWLYKRRTVFLIEEYVFNRLMRPQGFKAVTKTDMTYLQYCATIASNKLPIILSGNFKSVSKVGGHIVCGIGFNSIGLEEVIVNDPYGYAINGYPTEAILNSGQKVAYGTRFFIKDNGYMTSLLITRL